MSSVFTPREREYLASGAAMLGRLATVGRDGTPHVVPTGFKHNPELDTIDVGGMALTETKKFRDIKRSGRAAIVIDDLASTEPWRPRGVEVRGRAEAIESPTAIIRLVPERVISWGIESDAIDERHARSVT